MQIIYLHVYIYIYYFSAYIESFCVLRSKLRLIAKNKYEDLS